MTKLEKAILFTDKLNRTEKIAMLYLAMILERRDEAFVDLKKMSEYLHVSVRHLYRVLKSLDDKGVIKVDWQAYGSIKKVSLTDELKRCHGGEEK